MANLGEKNGVYLARFRYLGREYKKSLKTTNRRDAEAALLEVQRTIHRLTVGMAVVPDGVDPGDFIISGGTLRAPAPVTPLRPQATVRAAAAEYLGNLGHMAESNRYTIGVHLRNLHAKLGAGADRPIGRVTPRDLELFLQARLRERAHTTVGKERATLVGFFAWAVGHGYLAESPAARLTQVKTGGDLPPFRTAAEIDAVIARGGLTKQEVWALWDTLYLTPAEIAGILKLVEQRSRQEVSYVLHAVAAYTGMRRGEILRLRWSDVEFDHDGLVARSRKQSRQAVEMKRRIDLHPELKTILAGWLGKRSKGQFVACDDGSLEPLARHLAVERFWQPLRRTAWSLPDRDHRLKLGFHTYRHSFASNLARAGVDQRVIGAPASVRRQFMGHTDMPPILGPGWLGVRVTRSLPAGPIPPPDTGPRTPPGPHTPASCAGGRCCTPADALPATLSPASGS